MLVRFILRRLALAVPVLLCVITLAFLATANAPGDPLAGLLPENATPEQYEAAKQEFGLDRSGPEQWARYVARTATGDLGHSLRTRRDVREDLATAASATLELAVVAFMLTALMGVALGVLAGARAGRALDYAISLFTIGGVAAPVFWLAIVAQLIFYSLLHWFPVGGRIDEFVTYVTPVPTVTGALLIDSILALNFNATTSVLWHLVLPAAILAYRAMGLVVRITRAAMIEALHAPYVQTARAFGARERRITSYHALRNALPPILTVLGLAFGELLTGSLLVEIVFRWPGLGMYTYQSIVALDYPGVIGVSLLITVIYVIANLVIDLAYPLADPRMRGRA